MEDSVTIPFVTPATHSVIGPSHAGKTHYVKRLLINHKIMFDKPISKIIYIYSVWQKVYSELEAALGELIEFRTDIPTAEELCGIWNSSHSETLVVLDDQGNTLLSEVNARHLLHIVSVLGHHAHINIIYILQSIYHGGKIMREVAINTAYYCLFANPRNCRQISTLASQMSSEDQKCIIDAYKKATSRNYGYLIMDLSPHTDKAYKYRTNIFPGEVTIVYR